MAPLLGSCPLASLMQQEMGSSTLMKSRWHCCGSSATAHTLWRVHQTMHGEGHYSIIIHSVGCCAQHYGSVSAMPTQQSTAADMSINMYRNMALSRQHLTATKTTCPTIFFQLMANSFNIFCTGVLYHQVQHSPTRPRCLELYISTAQLGQLSTVLS